MKSTALTHKSLILSSYIKNKLLTGIVFWGILLVLLAGGNAQAAAAVTFLDTQGHWAQAEIEKAVSDGYVKGYPDATFRPNRTVTRAEYVTMLNVVFNVPMDGRDSSYQDVKTGDWFAQNIWSADKAGYTVEVYPEDTFKPNLPLTRQEAAALTANLTQIGPGEDEKIFADGDRIAVWAQQQVKTMSSVGVINGYPDGYFRPDGDITRAEAVAIINRAQAYFVSTQPAGSTENISSGSEPLIVSRHSINDRYKGENSDSSTVIAEQPGNTDIDYSGLLEDLALYQCNIRLKDGTMINSADLLNMGVSDFSEEQLVLFTSFLKELSKYPPIFTLANGEEIIPGAIGIMGTAQLTAEQMEAYLAGEASRMAAKMESMGRAFEPMPQLAELYLRIGEDYGVRGDIAYFQAVKETGYFQFTGSVQPWQNNYCGLWATASPCTGEESLNGADPEQVRLEEGVYGAIFTSPEAGVEAHIQHLFAYATTEPLPEGKVLVDPRFSLVSRGIAPDWMQLNGRWAVPGTTYAQSIIYDYWAKVF